MKIELSYTELSEYVLTHFNQEISIAYIDSKIVDVKAKVTFVPVKLTIKVESLIGTDLTVSYGGPIGTGLLITGALAFLSSRMPNYDKAIETAESNRILVHLCEFNQLSSVLEKVELVDLQFSASSIIVQLKLK
jgi:tetrahydromethanopterin S-methyltransferase subunit G